MVDLLLAYRRKSGYWWNNPLEIIPQFQTRNNFFCVKCIKLPFFFSANDLVVFAAKAWNHPSLKYSFWSLNSFQLIFKPFFHQKGIKLPYFLTIDLVAFAAEAFIELKCISCARVLSFSAPPVWKNLSHIQQKLKNSILHLCINDQPEKQKKQAEALIKIGVKKSPITWRMDRTLPLNKGLPLKKAKQTTSRY